MLKYEWIFKIRCEIIRGHSSWPRINHNIWCAYWQKRDPFHCMNHLCIRYIHEHVKCERLQWSVRGGELGWWEWKRNTEITHLPFRPNIPHRNRANKYARIRATPQTWWWWRWWSLLYKLGACDSIYFKVYCCFDCHYLILKWWSTHDRLCFPKSKIRIIC